MIYICVVPNFWGKGKTVAQAKANCAKAGRRITRHVPMRVYECADEGAYVNDWGAVCYARGSAVAVVEEQNPKPRK